MTTLASPSRWSSKPPLGAEVDRGLARARGLVGYWPFLEGAGRLVSDLSGRGKHGTLTSSIGNTGGPQWASGRDGGPALDFFRTSESIVNLGRAPWLANLGPMTAMAWVRPTTLDAMMVVGTYNAVGTDGWWILELNAAGITDTLAFAATFAAGTLQRLTLPDGKLSANKWTHVAVAWPGDALASSVLLYVDGLPPSGYQSDADGAGARINDSARDSVIGCASDLLTLPFRGRIEDVRVYNRVLSGAEILDEYREPWGLLHLPTLRRVYDQVGAVAGHPAMRRLGRTHGLRPVELGRRGVLVT